MQIKESESKHFHCIEKGCKIVPKTFFEKHSKTDGAYCKTHHVDICKCGWEWHWHYGNYTPLSMLRLPKQELLALQSR